MARGKKDQLVDTVEHRSGVRIEIYFDPNSPRHHHETGLTFSAKVADKTFRHKNADDLKRQVYDYLDQTSKLDWVPVIELTE